jgi:hypothetical protein
VTGIALDTDGEEPFLVHGITLLHAKMIPYLFHMRGSKLKVPNTDTA